MRATITALRERADLTQTELAERLGVTQGAVSQWEHGLAHPSIRLLPKLADILGCTVDELLRETA